MTLPMTNDEATVALAYAVLRLTCLKCTYSWLPRHPKPPAVCPKCKSRTWTVPKKEKVQKEVA